MSEREYHAKQRATAAENAMAEMAQRAKSLHKTLADAIGNPDRVWCRMCGRSEPVNAARALRHGWPKCCSYTMTIDKPATPEEHP